MPGIGAVPGMQGMLTEPMVCRPIHGLSTPWCFIALVAFVGFPFVSNCRPPEPSTPPTTDDNVIGWALGSGQLASETPLGGSIVPVLSGQPPPPPVPSTERPCQEIVSFVPAPPPDPSLYALVKGRLKRLATYNAAPADIAGADMVPHVTHLLAFAKRSAPPFELLVAILPPDKQKQELRLVTIKEGAITAAYPPDRRSFASPKAFFETYEAPRCQPGGKNCLVLSRVKDHIGGGEVTYIELEPARNKPRTTFMDLGGIGVVDAVWAPGSDRKMLVTVPCEKKN